MKMLESNFHKLVWALCGDDNFTSGDSTKVDPCLKLIKGCSLMINNNTEKKTKNIVKGNMAKFIGVRWKKDKFPHVENYHGFSVNCGHISDIQSLIIQLQTDKRHVEILPEYFPCSIKLPHLTVKTVLKGYKMLQFPVNLSLVVTGHKLQGMTLDTLILSEINLTHNWLYVLLSRVTTLNGLFLLKPLKREMFKPVNINLKRELEWF
jgi:hypothetical protein